MQTGTRIKLMREEHQLSATELASRAGIDKDYLNKVESEVISPSLGTLIKLARALGVRPGTFLDDDQNKGIVITRSHDALSRHKDTAAGNASRDNLSFISLARGKSNRHMDPFLIEVEPEHPLHNELSSHEGEEFIFVINGAIEVVYGKEKHLLHAGDSIYYDSVVGHQVKAHGNEKATILAVVQLPA